MTTSSIIWLCCHFLLRINVMLIIILLYQWLRDKKGKENVCKLYSNLYVLQILNCLILCEIEKCIGNRGMPIYVVRNTFGIWHFPCQQNESRFTSVFMFDRGVLSLWIQLRYLTTRTFKSEIRWKSTHNLLYEGKQYLIFHYKNKDQTKILTYQLESSYLNL